MDLGAVIDQLMAIQRRPLDRILAKQAEVSAQISAYGRLSSSVESFRTALSSLRNEPTFNPTTATTSDADVAGATADSSAVASSYSLTVTNIATAHKIASSAYTDSSTAVGTGTMTLTVDGTSLAITVDSSNNTLAGLRDAINTASGNPGVKASLITEDAGTRLILTAEDTGASNAISVTFADGDDASDTDQNGLSKLFYFGAGDDGYAETVTTAVDAQVNIDGFDITSASNSLTSAVDGLTINLVAAGSATVTVARDDATIEASVQAFVDAYNSLRSTISSLRSTDLRYDSTLSSIERGLLSVINTPATGVGDFSYMVEVGISKDRYGTMTLDSDEFAAALASDPDGLMKLFTDDTQGYAERLYDFGSTLISSNGAIGVREDGLSTRQTYLKDEQFRLESVLEGIELRYVQQFAALDQTVASLQGTSSYLTNQLSAMFR
ncbi:MAG: flagellar filament capping protein FliD [Sedimenticola sp.]